MVPLVRPAATVRAARFITAAFWWLAVAHSTQMLPSADWEATAQQVRAGRSAGGAIFNAGTGALSNCTFYFSFASGARGGGGSPNEPGGKGGLAQGGAILNAGTFEIASATFSNN